MRSVTGEAADPRIQILLSSHSPSLIVEAWNGEERDFIYQVRVQEGQAVIRPFGEVVADQSIQLRMRGGERRELGLRTADEVMDGYYS